MFVSPLLSLVYPHSDVDCTGAFVYSLSLSVDSTRTKFFIQLSRHCTLTLTKSRSTIKISSLQLPKEPESTSVSFCAQVWASRWGRQAGIYLVYNGWGGRWWIRCQWWDLSKVWEGKKDKGRDMRRGWEGQREGLRDMTRGAKEEVLGKSWTKMKRCLKELEGGKTRISAVTCQGRGKSRNHGAGKGKINRGAWGKEVQGKIFVRDERGKRKGAC